MNGLSGLHPYLQSAAIIAVSLAVIAAESAGAAAEQLGVPVPAGSRATESGTDAGLIESSHGFRQTVRFYRKHFQRKGLQVRQVPTYAYRGVTVARFLAGPEERTPWLAVHVFRHVGRTYIRVVPRGDRDAVRKTP